MWRAWRAPPCSNLPFPAHVNKAVHARMVDKEAYVTFLSDVVVRYQNQQWMYSSLSCVLNIAWSPCSTYLLIVENPDRIVRWKPENNETITFYSYFASDLRARHCVWHRTAGIIVCSNREGYINFFGHTTSLKRRARLAELEEVTGVSVNADGSLLAFADTRATKHFVTVYKSDSLSCLWFFLVDNVTNSVFWLSHTRLLVFPTRLYSIVVFDQDRLVHRQELTGFIDDVEILPTGYTRIATTSSSDGDRIYLLNNTTYELTCRQIPNLIALHLNNTVIHYWQCSVSERDLVAN